MFKTTGKVYGINKLRIKKHLKKNVFDDIEFQKHIDETSKDLGIDQEIVDMVVKHYLNTIMEWVVYYPLNYVRIVLPVGLYFKVHINKKRFKTEKK